MIRTHDLTKKFARNEALHGLSMEVPAGSVFALVGPNGAGKSTLFGCLLGQLPYASQECSGER